MWERCYDGRVTRRNHPGLPTVCRDQLNMRDAGDVAGSRQGRQRVQASENLRNIAPDSPDSWASSEAVRRSMRGNRGRDTRPEVAMRSALHAAGLRFRKNYRPLPGSRAVVDVAFTRWKVAVQLDGCFWHGCPEHGSRPATNTDYWDEKLRGNAERDRRLERVLADHGWSVLRFWEHESTGTITSKVSSALELARATRSESRNEVGGI